MTDKEFEGEDLLDLIEECIAEAKAEEASETPTERRSAPIGKA